MNRKQKNVVIFILVLIVVASITFSFRNIFHTTQYYKTPLLAYNATCSYDMIYGDTKVENEIGVLNLDDKNCLFLGDLNECCFVVAEIAIKNGKYASKGSTLIYDLTGKSDGINGRNLTYTSDGCIYWSIMYEQSELSVLSNINFIETYTHSNGHTIYLVVYNN